MAHEQQTTLYVIAYDVTDDRRRGKVHKLLCGYGVWTQFSLFECYLTPKQYLLLRERVERLLEPAEDSVRFYALCAACRKQVEIIGGQRPEEPLLFLV
jgi:CRISPR-associated protein Cas2